jgi:hypothetical protein
MPQGYYTIEQWKQPKRETPSEWVPVLTLPFGGSLTAAEEALAQLGKPGFYRVVQTQRVIWAERSGGNVRLRKSHADSPDGLDRIRRMFERCGGRYPIEEVRETRRQAKRHKADQ